jgi:hypothetical protein
VGADTRRRDEDLDKGGNKREGRGQKSEIKTYAFFSPEDL